MESECVNGVNKNRSDDIIDDEEEGNSNDEDYHQPGEDDDESCPICLNEFVEQKIGIPSECLHAFCVDCILEWSKNANSCPVDRKVFHSVLVYRQFGGAFVHELAVEGNACKIEEDEIETICEICGCGNNEESLLLCDGCDKAYHCACLSPQLSSVPTGEWFCDACRAGRVSPPTPSNVNARLVGRTIASERVRSRITRTRLRHADNNSTLDEQLDAIVNDIINNAGQRLRIKTPPVRERKPRTKNKRKVKLRKPRSRKKNYQKGRKVGAMKSASSSSQSEINAMSSFSLMGHADDLDEYSSKGMQGGNVPSYVIAQKHRLLSQSAIRFNEPLPSLLSFEKTMEPALSPPPPIPDLLTNIFTDQELLLAPSENVTIQRGGSLSLKEKKSFTSGTSSTTTSGISKKTSVLLSSKLLNRTDNKQPSRLKFDISTTKSAKDKHDTSLFRNKDDNKNVKEDKSSKIEKKSSSGRKGRRILIRPVFNLPKTLGGDSKSNDSNETYDPFQPTEDNDEKNSDAMLYDPFQPLSDEEKSSEPMKSIKAENNKSADPVDPPGNSSFRKVDLKMLTKPDDTKAVSDSDLDIEAMLDSQLDAAAEITTKVDDKTIELSEPEEVPEDFPLMKDVDIFAEDEIESSEVVQDSIGLPPPSISLDALDSWRGKVRPSSAVKDEPVKLPTFQMGKTSLVPIKFKKLTRKIKSAFAPEDEKNEELTGDSKNSVKHTDKRAPKTETHRITKDANTVDIKPEEVIVNKIEKIKKCVVPKESLEHIVISPHPSGYGSIFDKSANETSQNANKLSKNEEKIKSCSSSKRSFRSRSPTIKWSKSRSTSTGHRSYSSSSRSSSRSLSPKRHRSRSASPQKHSTSRRRHRTLSTSQKRHRSRSRSTHRRHSNASPVKYRKDKKYMQDDRRDFRRKRSRSTSRKRSRISRRSRSRSPQCSRSRRKSSDARSRTRRKSERSSMEKLTPLDEDLSEMRHEEKRVKNKQEITMRRSFSKERKTKKRKHVSNIDDDILWSSQPHEHTKESMSEIKRVVENPSKEQFDITQELLEVKKSKHKANKKRKKQILEKESTPELAEPEPQELLIKKKKRKSKKHIEKSSNDESPFENIKVKPSKKQLKTENKDKVVTEQKSKKKKKTTVDIVEIETDYMGDPVKKHKASKKKHKHYTHSPIPGSPSPPDVSFDHIFSEFDHKKKKKNKKRASGPQEDGGHDQSSEPTDRVSVKKKSKKHKRRSDKSQDDDVSYYEEEINVYTSEQCSASDIFLECNKFNKTPDDKDHVNSNFCGGVVDANMDNDNALSSIPGGSAGATDGAKHSLSPDECQPATDEKSFSYLSENDNDFADRLLDDLGNMDNVDDSDEAAKLYEKQDITSVQDTHADIDENSLSQEIDVDLLLENPYDQDMAANLLNQNASAQSKEIDNNLTCVKPLDPLSEENMRSPSPLSPSLLSPESGSEKNVIDIQNSSLVLSSQEFKETPSYAETFLEQSRQRWAKNLRNKSPRISTCQTPDEIESTERTLRDTPQGTLLGLYENPQSGNVVKTEAISENVSVGSPAETSVKRLNKSHEIKMELSTFDKILGTTSPDSIEKDKLSDNISLQSHDTDMRVLLQSGIYATAVDQLQTEQVPKSQTSKSCTVVKERPNELKSSNSVDSSDHRRSSDEAGCKSSSEWSSKSFSSSSSLTRHERSHRKSKKHGRSKKRQHRRSSSPSKRSHHSSYKRKKSRDESRDKGRLSRKRRSTSPTREHHRDSFHSSTQKPPPRLHRLKSIEKVDEWIPSALKVAEDNAAIQKTKTELSVPQPISTISVISSNREFRAHDDLQQDELPSITLKSLVNKTKPALIQIPTEDNPTFKDKQTPSQLIQVATSTNLSNNVKDPRSVPATSKRPNESDLYSPSCPMSPISPDEGEDLPPPPPPKEASSIDPGAASLASTLVGLKKDELSQAVNFSVPDSPKEKQSENVLNPTQILNIVGLNPQVEPQDASMSVAELSKRLQLGQILSNNEKKAKSKHKSKHRRQKDADGLSPVNIDNIESSAVALYNRDKKKMAQKKKDFQKDVIAAAKIAIKPHYERREVSKAQYKDIMKRAVNKICQTDHTLEVNAVKVRRLIRRYVESYQRKNEKSKEKMRLVLDLEAKSPDGSEYKFCGSPPSPEGSPFTAPGSSSDDNAAVTPSLLKKEPRKVVTLPDLPLPPPPPPPRPRFLM